MAQKPADQTYLNNMFKHEVGLLDTKIRIGDNMYPAKESIMITKPLSHWLFANT